MDEIDGDQNIGQKRTPLRTRSFLSLMVHFKKFHPKCGLNKINTKLFTQYVGHGLVAKEFNSILRVQASNFTNDMVVVNDGILTKYSIPN
jgi:hypothetical protein